MNGPDGTHPHRTVDPLTLAGTAFLGFGAAMIILQLLISLGQSRSIQEMTNLLRDAQTQNAAGIKRLEEEGGARDAVIRDIHAAVKRTARPAPAKVQP